jgi:hypothetical protein
MGDLSLPQFADVVRRSNVPPDQFVAIVTDTLSHLEDNSQDVEFEDGDEIFAQDDDEEMPYKRIRLDY